MKNQKGNIILTFVFLVTLASILAAYLFLISGKTRDVTFQQDHFKAFSLAEAGMQKAIWYLGTGVGAGGKGGNWRGSITESVGSGIYSITVQDTVSPSKVLVISTGEAGGIRETIIQQAAISALHDAFSYAFFANNGFRITSGVFSGNAFVNGDAIYAAGAQVTNGKSYHPAGDTVSGNAVDGGVPDPLPSMPSLNTAYYDGEIAIAEGVAPGDQSYSNNLDLSAGPVYVNGKVVLEGSITGPGVLVATEGIRTYDHIYSDGSDIIFISGAPMSLNWDAIMPNSTIYSEGRLSFYGFNIEVGSALTSAGIYGIGNINFRGLLYCEGEADLHAFQSLTGSLVVGQVTKPAGTFTFDENALPSISPPGLEGGSPTYIKGTWQELED